MTQLPRPSMRYWHHNATVLFQGHHFSERPFDSFDFSLLCSVRSCPQFVKHRHLFADPLACGLAFQDCCDRVDVPDFPVTECGVGVSPTLCTGAESIQDPCSGPSELINRTRYVTWPCNFRVITWNA